MFSIYLHPDQFLVRRFQKHKDPACAAALMWDAVTRDKYCAQAHFPVQTKIHHKALDIY